MMQYAIIPKRLPARDSMEYMQKIPKIIWQTMKTSDVPVFMKNYADTWIGLNPEYEYRFYDDDDIVEIIKNEFPDFLEGYKKIKYGASKSDLWRYLVMYKYGGVYADIDCRCINPLREWIDPAASYVTQLGTNRDVCQWLLISIPQNPIFLRAAQKTLQNLEQNSAYASHQGFEVIKNRLVIKEDASILKFNHEVLALSGPPVLQEAAETCLKEGLIDHILSFTQIVCVSETISCHMSNNVRHDSGHNSYKKALKNLKTNYYDMFISRIRRKFFDSLRAATSLK